MPPPIKLAPLPALFFLILTPCIRADHHTLPQPQEYEAILLNEIVVSSPSERVQQQAQATSVMTADQLNLALESSLGQTLARMPGVSSSFFGPAASRPVMRGLEGDRVRVLQNGLNTTDASALSPDHALSFDPSNLRSVEVIRGPATLLYGSGAIGGIVNAIDGRIVEEKLDGTIRGSLGGRFSSVDQGYQSNMMLEGGLAGLAFHVEAFTRAAEDYHIPGNTRTVGEQERNPPAFDQSGLALNSRLRNEGFSAGLSHVWDKGFLGFSWTEFHNIYGSPTESAVFIDLYQTRLDVRGAFERPLPLIKKIDWRFAWSDYEHTEHDNGANNTAFKNEGYDLRVEMRHEKIAGMEGVVGIQSERSDFFVAGTEAFLPPSVTESNSLFFFEDITRGPLSFQFGGRHDHIETRSRDSNVFGTSRRRDFDNLSGAAGVVFSPNDEYSSAFTIGYSERAPTAQELFSNGDHAATGTFETGDFGLGVEHALNFDLNLRKRTGRITGGVSGYHSRYDGFIGLFPTSALGPAPDFNPVFAYRSVAAEFTGGELKATLHLLHPVTSQPDKPATNLHWEFKVDVVRARDASTGLSLPRIPPFHLTSALILEHGNFGARLEGVYAAPQRRIAANESGTPAYFLVNLSLTYRLARGPNTLDLYVKGMNLTDAEAREHTSFLKERLPLPGRGIVAGMKWSF